ncbi:ENDD1 protein, partial [Atractosteus spatula]|nr:ENDD1 protein [Atractosteus spatula]
MDLSHSGISLLLVFIAASVSVVRASVGETFRECKQFMYKGTPPAGLTDDSLLKICQHYNNRPRFATLYDAKKRIPVYSAYTFKKSDGEKRVNFPWMYEPQLSSMTGTNNMQPFPRGGSEVRIEESQAILQDYSDAILYERGPLNPDQHQASPSDKAATYTLTNIVPQVKEFYNRHWSAYIDSVRKRFNNYCNGKAYVVTGVTTSGNMIRRENTDRVGIPKYIWSAYCCPNYDLNAPYDVRYKFPTFAAYGLNEMVNNFVTEVSPRKLETLLKREMNVDQDFQLFYRDCVAD